MIFERLTEQEKEIYNVMLQLKAATSPVSVGGISEGGTDPEPDYEIPGEALNDLAFAALMEEATKIHRLAVCMGRFQSFHFL